MVTKFRSFILSEIDLGLENHDQLNPVLWDEGGNLRPEIRQKLLDFAHALQGFGHIPSDIVKDIWIVGGNCGYNYTRYSDIDVHVIIQKDLLGTGIVIDQYLKSVKLLWSAKHNVKVKGYSLEGYFEDISEPIKSDGIFSLQQNQWIKKPTPSTGHDYENNTDLQVKVKDYQDLIDHMISQKASLKAFEDLKHKISDMRKQGLATGGEFSIPNLAFKGLRNTGYLDKMTRYMIDTVDQSLSL